MTDVDKLREMRALLNLYDNAITKQRNLLDQANDGTFKYAQVEDKVLQGLVRGELKLLEMQKNELEISLEKLEKKSDE